MTTTPEEFCIKVRTSLIQSGIFSENGIERSWRVSPKPFELSKEDHSFFLDLGDSLLTFYKTLNSFYFESLKDRFPPWFAQYLDNGKPSDLLNFSQMKRFKPQLPGIIRPDVIVTEDRFIVTELDSVPGGFGSLTQLMELYEGSFNSLPGMENGGIPSLFSSMIREVAGKQDPTLAITVSDEAKDYLDEMMFLGARLNEGGLKTHVIHPKDIIFDEEGLFVENSQGKEKIDVLYRFFELFDLKNIPKSELLMYSAKKGKIKTTPPYKPFLEEKLSFALFKHPTLKSFWEKSLGFETFQKLSHLIPSTWILDNRELPPYATIPDLEIKGNKINNWNQLFAMTQKEREFAVKVSGFSPKSWGGRGVTIGHDVAGQVWDQTIKSSLEGFPKETAILQKFHKGKRFRASYMGLEGGIKEMESRVRLTPYYFVIGNQAKLGGILATLCHKDKKKIHGMTDAIMVPCSVAQ
jgi:hypothetical protein